MENDTPKEDSHKGSSAPDAGQKKNDQSIMDPKLLQDASTPHPAPQQEHALPPGPPGAPFIVTQQPPTTGGATPWMPIPHQVNPNCPPGLEYLSVIDQLLVKQKIESTEARTGFETENRYFVQNISGQRVFDAKEESGCCARYWCDTARPFEMSIVDNYDNTVIHAHRPLACQSCLYPCCLQSMEVSAPPGTLLGTVEQQWSPFRPKLNVKDEAGNVVLRIQGPVIIFDRCRRGAKFKVFSVDGKEVGEIEKQYAGYHQERYTDADNFGISFPMDLDVKMKAVMLGACFLIDYMFFEHTGKKNGCCCCC